MLCGKTHMAKKRKPSKDKTPKLPSRRIKFSGFQFALVICRNPKTGLYLGVNDTRNRGWWMPGGSVAEGDTFFSTACRVCLEEAGIDVALQGILGIEHVLYKTDRFKMRVIYYAEPMDEDQVPLSPPDKESL